MVEEVASASGAILALAAAIVWFLAARVKLPRFSDVGWDSPSKQFDPVWKSLNHAAKLNALAAALSGGAAVMGFIAFFAHLL